MINDICETVAIDATSLLRADHKLISALFAEYEKVLLKIKKKHLIAQICTNLTVYAQVEEDIFYTAVKIALKDFKFITEAMIEHATLKALIAQVEGKEPDGEMFDTIIKVLYEHVKHHVKGERKKCFLRSEQLN